MNIEQKILTNLVKMHFGIDISFLEGFNNAEELAEYLFYSPHRDDIFKFNIKHVEPRGRESKDDICKRNRVAFDEQLKDAVKKARQFQNEAERIYFQKRKEKKITKRGLLKQINIELFDYHCNYDCKITTIDKLKECLVETKINYLKESEYGEHGVLGANKTFEHFFSNYNDRYYMTNESYESILQELKKRYKWFDKVTEGIPDE